LVTSEGGGSPEGGFHGGVARPEGNGGEGRRPVVQVGGSWFGKVVGTWAVVGVALMERIGGRRRLGGGRRWQDMELAAEEWERVRWHEEESEWEGTPPLQPRQTDKGARG
jgi:hypothetical protein